MNDLFIRTEALFGRAAMERLQNAHVAVFGLGGVGGHACEALARSGVGTLTVVDSDTVARSNRNRQLIALESTVGMKKTEVMAKRLRDINPEITVIERDCFFDASTADTFDFSDYDYVIDCIDTVASKLLLITLCQSTGTPLIASMGTGNKTDPTRLRVSDISKTSVCPLAKAMRLECRKRGIRHYRVLWSDEVPLTPSKEALTEEAEKSARRSVPASTAFVPPAAGILLAREVVMQLITSTKENDT